MAQGTRTIAVETPLGKDALQLRHFSGSEQISRLFHFHLEMACPEQEVKQDKLISNLVGKNVTIRLDLNNDKDRYFNGCVSRIAADYGEDDNVVYRAEMVPWLWFLTQTSNCRIFQNQTVKDILKSVFGDHEFSGAVDDSKLSAAYPQWEYCVQYRETDFNFVSRLMEQCGIFYYFKHEDGKHKLILGDSDGAYDPLPGKVDMPLSRHSGQSQQDQLLDWHRELEFVSGKWAHTDYNFEKPSDNLMSNTETRLKHPDAKKYEIYDYPGEYGAKGDSDREVKVRMEEEETSFDQATAASNCRVFYPGGVFEVGDHPADDAAGKKFLITSIQHQASAGAYSTGAASGGADYTNTFRCIPDSVRFRPARSTPKPLVSGIQTAVVTGPKGEEIYTDKFGRVKVQFHWDREVDNPKMAGVGDKQRACDQSSCFIRCAQNSAGKKYGFMSIPRIGQEVVVDFLEGDPDRPLIVGSVYNGEQLPHYDPSQAEHKTKTYFKTNSTKGGDGFNELMFDDAKDKEQVFIHAQKDMDVRVKNHYTEHVAGNRHHIVDGEEGAGNGEDGGNLWEMIGRDKHLNVKRHQVDHTEGNLQLTVGNGDAGDGGVLDTVVEKMERRKVGADGLHLEVDGDVNEKIGGNLSTEVSDHNEKAANYALQTDQNVHIKAGMNLVLEAGMSLSLKVGGSFITLTPATVDIKGAPLVQINTGGSAGKGAGAQPDSPKPSEQAKSTKPKLARKEKTGVKSAPD